MGGIDFFPPPHYARGQVFTFVKPSYTEWTLIEKLEQRSWRQDEADTSYGGFPSFARATFLVRKESIDREAFMRIYQQVPSKGTEFFPPEERANQAASSGNHAEFEAVRTFYEKKSPITPALLAYKEEIQDRQGLIPGGYVILFVFERVPGVPLAEDKILPGYGAPLHRFFREFDDDERKQIRQHFDEGYIKLQKLGWEPAYPWASHLIWDKSSTKLYFVDFREARPTAHCHEDDVEDGPAKPVEEPSLCATWEEWGLAIAPAERDRGGLSKWTL